MGLKGLWVFRCMGSEGFDCTYFVVYKLRVAGQSPHEIVTQSLTAQCNLSSFPSLFQQFISVGLADGDDSSETAYWFIFAISVGSATWTWLAPHLRPKYTTLVSLPNHEQLSWSTPNPYSTQFKLIIASWFAGKTRARADWRPADQGGPGRSVTHRTIPQPAEERPRFPVFSARSYEYGSRT